MGVNMFCESQKTSSKEYISNWDLIFKRYWVVLKTSPPEILKCRKVHGCYQEDYFDLSDQIFVKDDLIAGVFESDVAAKESLVN